MQKCISALTLAAGIVFAVQQPGPVAADGAKSTEHKVDMVAGNKFVPDNLTIKVGDSVRFVNSSVNHTATSIDVKTADPRKTFNTGVVKPGQEAVLFFNVPGTFEYRCEIHPGSMKGTIKVEASK